MGIGQGWGPASRESPRPPGTAHLQHVSASLAAPLDVTFPPVPGCSWTPGAAPVGLSGPGTTCSSWD